MKHLKSYENLNLNKLKPGNYIIAKFEFSNTVWSDFIDNNIGIYIEKTKAYRDRKFVDIYLTKYYLTDDIYNSYFKNVPDRVELLDFENGKKIIIMQFQKKHIIYYSKDINNTKAFLTAKKYNI
jgi:hypothetical protein